MYIRFHSYFSYYNYFYVQNVIFLENNKSKYAMIIIIVIMFDKIDSTFSTIRFIELFVFINKIMQLLGILDFC